MAATADDNFALDEGLTASLLDTLGKTSRRAIAIVRPEVVDGRMVDGTILWVSDRARRMDPTAKPGATLRAIYGDALAHQDTSKAADLALRQPGEAATWGPIRLDFPAGHMYLEVSVTYIDTLFFVEYIDRTAEFAEREAAKEADHNFRDLLEGLDAGVVLLQPELDSEGRVVDAEIVWSNRASESMWIRKEGLIIGTRVTSIYYDLSEWLEAANSAWDGRPATRVLQPDPAVAHWTAATETIRRVGDTLVELTIDRSDDQALLDRLDELDHRFRSLVNDLPLTVLVTTLGSDSLDFVSPNAAALTGYPLADLQRMSSWMDLAHPDDRHMLPSFGPTVRERGHDEITLRMIRADGTVVPVSLRGARREVFGEATGLIVLVADITEQQRMMDRAAAGERLETLGRTAGSIAHDFNNLLMIVAGNLDRAQRQLGHDSLALNTAYAATTRAAELAGSLLGFARGRPGTPGWVAMSDLVQHFEPIMNGALFPKANLHVDIEPDLPSVWADRAQVEQMLLNLVTNARDAIDDRGRVTLKVTKVDRARCHLLDQPATAPHLAIAVSDTGSGMTPDVLTKVWEPFFSSKSPTEHSGTGLGLSTVHGLAHQHGGHVAIDTAVGEGTTVTIYLPLPAAR